jgi:hypothetical protein
MAVVEEKKVLLGSDRFYACDLKRKKLFKVIILSYFILDDLKEIQKK